jgi:hypothetical protein
MAQVQNYEYNDFTDELLLIPNEWGLLNSLGLFGSDSVATSVLQFDETAQTLTLIEDQRRGTRKQVNRDDYSKLHTVGIPHFPFDDAISPQDIINRRRPGDKDAEDTIARVRLQKMERLRKSWAATVEYARMQALMGNVYNPNQTNDVQNWYTEFGVTQTEVEYELDTATTNVIAKGEAAIAASQDNILSGEVVSEFVAICSPEFFASLIAHAEVKDAYLYYSSGQEPLRDRLTSSLGARHREFTFGGIRYVEYRGSYTDKDGNSVRIVPANEAYLFPLGTSDTFVTYYAPADRFEYVFTAGLEQYMWEFPDDRGHLIEIESESNFINMVRRPQCVIKLHRNTAP